MHYIKGDDAYMAKPKFSEEICNCLIENYSEGLPLIDCADIAGVHRNTVTNWMNKGKKAKSGKFKQFYQDMVRARAKFKKHHQLKIAESKDWRASQYLLQVTDSEHYVITEKQEVKADIDSKNKHELDPRVVNELNDLFKPRYDRADSE